VRKIIDVSEEISASVSGMEMREISDGEIVRRFNGLSRIKLCSGLNLREFIAAGKGRTFFRNVDNIYRFNTRAIPEVSTVNNILTSCEGFRLLFPRDCDTKFSSLD